MAMMGWAADTVGLLLLVSTIPLGFFGLGLLTDWLEMTAWFDPARGGSVKFFLYVFWTCGHPAIYLPFIPAIAILYKMMLRFLGRPMCPRTGEGSGSPTRRLPAAGRAVARAGSRIRRGRR
jgi:heme/copper-type cytochrome/quinol oxidase subunit 1